MTDTASSVPVCSWRCTQQLWLSGKTASELGCTQADPDDVWLLLAKYGTKHHKLPEIDTLLSALAQTNL